MSTTTHPTITSTPAEVSLQSTFKAEWTKLRTLRSTWVTVVGSGLVSLLLAAVVAATQISDWDEMTPKQRAEFDPTSAALVGVLFATVFFGALAVRSVTGEYSTGMIRQTLTAIPRRRLVLLAKSSMLLVVAVPAALAANVVAFLLGQQLLSSKNADVSITDGASLRAILYGSLAVGITAVLGVGLGTIIRHTAAATTALSVAIIGSQLFGIALPAAARPYLPGSALQAAVTRNPADDLLAPHTGLAVLAAYTVVTAAAALGLVTRRDV